MFKLNNIQILSSDISRYYDLSRSISEKFGGSSIYFHQECIKAGMNDYLSDRHIEMLYATLTAWGMHRMGDVKKTKAKLVEYSSFKKSILDLKKELFILKETKLEQLEENK